MVDFDSENFINEAEKILAEGVGGTYQLQLDRETVKCVDELLKITQLIDSTMARMFKRPTRLGISHPDSMESILRNKFKPLLEESEPHSKLSVEFERREVVYLNNKLAKGIDGARVSGSLKLDQIMGDKLKEVNLSWLQDAIPTFRDLNSSFAKAGGEPHPDAVRMFDELKPKNS